jgi:hypothetical protein
VAEHENLSGERKHQEAQSSTQKCPCTACCATRSSVNLTKETVSCALQTSIYMDYLCVEDQIVQMFYQQVSLLPPAIRLSLSPEIIPWYFMEFPRQM